MSTRVINRFFHGSRKKKYRGPLNAWRSVTVSSHARKGMMRRMGIHAGDVRKVAERAWNDAVKPVGMKFYRKPANDGRYKPQYAGHRYAYRKKGDCVFVFDRDGVPHPHLVTILGPFGPDGIWAETAREWWRMEITSNA